MNAFILTLMLVAVPYSHPCVPIFSTEIAITHTYEVKPFECGLVVVFADSKDREQIIHLPKNKTLGTIIMLMNTSEASVTVFPPVSLTINGKDRYGPIEQNESVLFVRSPGGYQVME